MFETPGPHNYLQTIEPIASPKSDNVVLPESQQLPPSKPILPDSSNTLPEIHKFDAIKNQCSQLISELDGNEDPVAVMKKHISQLQNYNELQDIALSLVTMIGDQHQLHTVEILREMENER